MQYDFKEPVLQMNGRSVVYIENYKKLLEYSRILIKIATRSGVLEVSGKNLEIRYYSKEDLEIKGLINKISFGE